MLDRVDALMREVAAEEVLPRFRHLGPGEVQEKHPGDLVTIADREAERVLTARLSALLPGSVVVGEEAVAADPSRLALLTTARDAWVVDPVDGTGNFAAGIEPFAMMVALLREGRTVAAWILHPVSGVAAIAERGAGATIGGRPVRAPATARPLEQVRGALSARNLPASVRSALATSGFSGELTRARNCAGSEYPALVLDEQQFVFFWRLLPWDHAPGTLLVEEAGGTVRHPDGRPYDPTRPGHALLIAQNEDTWQAVRDSLLTALSSEGAQGPS